MKIEIEIDERDYVLEVWLKSYKLESEEEECHGMHTILNETYQLQTEVPDLEDKVLDEIWEDYSADLIEEFYNNQTSNHA